MRTLIKRKNDEFENLVNQFFGVPESNPKTNWSVTDENHIFEMALAGMDKKDIKISVDGEYLIVESERESKNVNHWSYQSFSKKIYLGDSVNQGKITSTMENGMLKIIIPKREKDTKKRLIEID